MASDVDRYLDGEGIIPRSSSDLEASGFFDNTRGIQVGDLAVYEKYTLMAERIGGVAIYEVMKSRLREGRSWNLELLRELIPNHEGVRVLDLGCATGLETIFMGINLRERGSVVGLDFVDGMIYSALKRVSKHNLDNVSFVNGDMDRVPFLDRTFDMVYSLSSFFEGEPEFYGPHADMQQERHWAKKICDTSRVIKKGGVFVVTSDFLSNSGEEDYCDVTSVYTSGRFLGVMADNGFSDLQINRHSFHNLDNLYCSLWMISGKKE